MSPHPKQIQVVGNCSAHWPCGDCEQMAQTWAGLAEATTPDTKVLLQGYLPLYPLCLLRPTPLLILVTAMKTLSQCI